MTQANAADVMGDVNAKLQSIAAIANKIVTIYDETDLTDKLKSIVFPGAGLVYEGMFSVPEKGPTNRVGVSAEMRFSIVLIMTREVISKTDVKVPMITLLDTLRKTLLGKQSPTGHKYHFMVEAPAKVKDGVTFWVQRWAVPIQLPPSQV